MKLAFNAEKCIGCKLCQLACSATHEGVFNPQKARLKVTSDYRPEGGLMIQAELCDYCQACVESCPTGAITLQNGGLSLDKEACVGCGDCIGICPNQVITLDFQGQPRLCDLCGGNPQCVAWCPHGALEVSANELL